LALTKALIRAAAWLDADNGANRAEAVEILSRSAYVGADAAVISNSMTGTFAFGEDDIRPAPDFNIFFRDDASYPFYSDAVWTLTQMRRWGQIPEAKPDGWYDEIARAVYKPALYEEAAHLLIAEGKAKPEDFPFGTDGYKTPTDAFIDGIEYDGRKPNDYLAKFPIGLKGDETVTSAGVQG
jgi:nitrate/nitrite transport system substrate-binding protein